jgi:hypothetical protein
MRRWLLASFFGGAIVTACVLPDVEIDPDLDTDSGDLKPGGGVGGSGVSVPPVTAGSSGAAGDNSDIDPDDIAPPGAGGSASDDMNAGSTMGGSGGAAGTGGTTAGTGGTGAGGTGAGGSGGSTGAGGSSNPPRDPAGVIRECTQDVDRESACIGYCQQFIEACGDFPAANTYEGVTDCTETCILSQWPVGDTTTGSGSICCRFLHATLAAQLITSQDPHCFHSAEVPSRPEMGGCAPGAVAPQ